MEIPYTDTEDVSREDRYSVQTTLEGRRRAQHLPGSARTWSVSIPVGHPEDLLHLDAFAQGAWGPGPWHWLPVQAQVGNLLTPNEAALLERATPAYTLDGGPLQTPDGTWTPRSLLVDLETGSDWLFKGIPVLPGRPFTWSLDVIGDGVSAPELITIYSDLDGNRIGTGDRRASSTVKGLHRTSMTLTPPAGAATVDVGVRSTVKRLARPQLSWTPVATPYTTGHGCRTAIVDGLESALKTIDQHGPVNAVSFTVMEVS
ncbi:hypothetical protein [Brachybacterium kimchii]|uniref:Uncharacterized protein n=1 Tax=Brachybacterium kimchii TaxID=2942909 RepID=A0ABY4N7W9_9MICO|nr:hypothetical protein [Brachybacterium kimchii]UQN30651.1 hypothetical protein M4486_04940 [Brachybacterium kimchii]